MVGEIDESTLFMIQDITMLLSSSHEAYFPVLITGSSSSRIHKSLFSKSKCPHGSKLSTSTSASLFFIEAGVASSEGFVKDEINFCSWELEIGEAEAGDSEEESENMRYGRSSNQRKIGGDGSYMNKWHGNVMTAGKAYEMQYNNGTVQVSSSTPNKMLANAPSTRKSPPDKSAVDGRISDEASKMVEIQYDNEAIQASLSTPNKVLENAALLPIQRKTTPDKGNGGLPQGVLGTENFGGSLVTANGHVVKHAFERTPIAEHGERAAGCYDICKVISGTNISNQTPYSDASDKRTPPSCSSRTSKLSCASLLSKDPSNRLSIPHQSSHGERSISPPASKQIADDFGAFEVTGINRQVSGKTDTLTVNQVHVMTDNGVALARAEEKPQNKSTKLKSVGSEDGSSCSPAVNAHNFLKNNLESSESNPVKRQSVETAQDRMGDPPPKKLLSFQRNSTKRLTAFSTSPADTLQAKVSELHVMDQAAFSGKLDGANMPPLEGHVTQGRGSLEMSSNQGGTKSLVFIDSGSISNQANNNAHMSTSLIPLIGQNNESKETNCSRAELLSSDHNFSPEKNQTGERAEACENEMNGSSSKNPSIKTTKKFVARKNTSKRHGISDMTLFDAKCGMSSGEGAATGNLTNGAAQSQADAQHEALEGKKNLEIGLTLTAGKVPQIDQENNRPSAQRPSNKTKRKSAVMIENDVIIDDEEKHSTKYKQYNVENQVCEKNVSKFEQANEPNVFALRSAEGRENIEKFLGPIENNMQHIGRKNSILEVPKSSSKLKRKAGIVRETNLDADKENQPNETESRNVDNVKKHSTGKIVSKSTQVKSKRGGVNSEGKIDASKAGKMSTSKQFEPQWFILSGHHLQRKEFQQVIKNLRGRMCRDSHHWCYQATHFIVPDPLRRTEKFFAAAAAGRWILKTDYLTASSQAGKFLNEEPFEWYKTGLSEDGAINLEAPRKWRLLRQRTGHGAFYGMNIIIYGECIAPSLDTLKRVVKAGDGSILATSPPYHRFLKSHVDFAIVSPGMPRVDAWIQEFLAHNVPCVLADYLVEFVCKPGYSLDRHVLYNTYAAAEKSHANHLQRLEVIEVPTQEDDILCSVCKLGDRAEVMLICGDDAGKAGCGVAMHIDCCDPPFDSVPESDWFCSKCCSSVSKKGAKNSSVLKRKPSLHVK
ncbi:BRCT domain-containing protein [Nymphaea thermarum]|nr:BRCT domain-containing protein [Nymphaea thermarum]